MTKFLLPFIVILFGSTSFITGQNVAINENGDQAHSSALLDIQSTTKGLLAPRMTTSQRMAISVDQDAAGLIVFDTDQGDYYFYNGSNWGPFGKLSDFWEGSGADITNINSGNIAVGTGSAEQKLHIFGNVKITDSGSGDGKLFIGTTPTDESGASAYSLLVGGAGIMTELKIDLTSNWDWPDYVFLEDYPLMPINELEQFIKTEGHLPGIPSAGQIQEEEGFMVGDIQRKMLEKIEELTLYMIDLKKENEQLRTELNELKAKIQTNDKK